MRKWIDKNQILLKPPVGFLFVLVVLSSSLFAQNNLSLVEAISKAGINNPRLKSERLNVPMTASDLKQAQLYQNPTFNLQYMQLMPRSMYYDQSRSFLHGINSQDWYQFTKKFQIFGQRKNKIDLAKMELSAAEINFLETKRNVLYEVGLKWVEAWRALAKKNLSIKAADYLDQYMSQNFDSLKNGGMKKEQSLRFSILDDQYDLERSIAEEAYFTAVEELKLLLGTAEPIEMEINDTLETVSLSGSLDSLLVFASKNRNDQKSFNIMKNYSLKNISYQRSLAIPQPEAGFIWNPQNTIPYLGLFYTQTLPFFDRNQAMVQKAKLTFEKASIDQETNKRKLENEVSVAFSNYKKRFDMASKFKHNLKDSETLVKLVRESYLKNEEPLVDLWEAEQTWIQSYTLYYDAFADYRASYLTLLFQLNLLE